MYGYYPYLLDVTDPTPTESLLTDIGTFFTKCMSWIGNVLDVIVSKPLLLITIIGFVVVGFGIGLVRRLIRA